MRPNKQPLAGWRAARIGLLVASCALALAACDQGAPARPPGAVSVSEAQALDKARVMLDERAEPQPYPADPKPETRNPETGAP